MSFRLLGWQCWEFWHFRGRVDAACRASLTSSTFSKVLPSSTSLTVPVWVYKTSRHFVMVVSCLTRQINAVLQDSVQASVLPGDWIATGFSNLSLNPTSTISLGPGTNYIPSLSLSTLIFKGDEITVRSTGDNGWKHLAQFWAQSQLSINRSKYDYFKSIHLFY